MKVCKRDGRLEEVNLDKITKSIQHACDGLVGVEPYQIAIKTVGGLYDGVSTEELDLLSIQTAVNFIAIDPSYSKVATRLMMRIIQKELERQDIANFSQSISSCHAQGLISDECLFFVNENKRKLNSAIKYDRNDLFEYNGIKTVYDRYLLKHPVTRKVMEMPQFFLMRVACGLSNDVNETIEFYNLLSSLEYMTSTPTLFNSGTRHSQMSSCYLLDSPADNLQDIYKRYSDVALLSKWAGGIGLSASRIRSSGSLIKGTNGKSNGIVPWLHTLSSSVSAVNQGGKRKGAAAIYLDTWHPDIMEFLELRDNTGDREKRAYNLNLANWIPDLFMKRVEEDGIWSLFDPGSYPELVDLYGDAFEKHYIELELEKKYVSQISARKVYAKMMKTLAETGNGWITFKDTCNMRCNSAVDGHVVKSSNLCTEIIEPTFTGSPMTIKAKDYTGEILNHSRVVNYNVEKNELEILNNGEVAVCNLGSLNLSRYITKDGKVDLNKIKKNVPIAIKFLDKVIDKNFYPIPEAHNSNKKWRPIGLGIMGWQDLLFKLRVPFESDRARTLAANIQEEIYYWALKTSMELAKEHGAHSLFKKTHAGNGKLQFDFCPGIELHDKNRWDELKVEIKKYGLRNSLLIAIAPTATIGQICGSTECIEPQISNIFKRETLSGEFITTNQYLVADLKKLGLWNQDMLDMIKMEEGSIQNIASIPLEIKELYKTVWEVKQKSIIDQAVARGAFIDQSQSLNLFMAQPELEKMGSMYFYAWKNGIKTTYYLRSKPASRIQKIISNNSSTEILNLENPEVCETCQ